MNEFKPLSQIEVAPPAQVWERIAHALEREPEDDLLASCFSKIDIEPPSDSWPKILQILNTTRALTSVKQNVSWLRLAAAAMLTIMLMAAIAYYFISHRPAPPPSLQVTAFEGNNPYVELRNANGEMMRVSRKLFQLACLKGETFGTTEEIIQRLRNENCFEKIRSWQQSLAYSTSLNSSGGLMNIEELMILTR